MIRPRLPRSRTSQAYSITLGAFLLTSCIVIPRNAAALELFLSADRNELILGQQNTIRITAEVSGDGAERVRGIQFVCASGSISAPRKTGERRWIATYTMPNQRFPQVELIIARTTGSLIENAFASLSIRLLGQTDLSLRTDPGALITLALGDREFGPERAGRDGTVRISVVVAPGQSRAIARSVDIVGNRSVREIPLNLPPYQRIVISSPERLVAGSTGRVALLSISDTGSFDTEVNLIANRGTLRNHETIGVLKVYELRAPEEIADGQIRLIGTRGRALSHDRVDEVIRVVPAAAHRIELTMDRPFIVPGTQQVLTVTATVRDRYNNVRPQAPITLHLAGQTLDVTELPQGGVIAQIEAPPTEVGIGAMVIEARSNSQSSQHTIRMVGGPATLARLEAPAQAIADGRSAARIRIFLVGETGLPANERPELSKSSGNFRHLIKQRDGWWFVDFIPDRARLLGPESATIEVTAGPASARARIRLTPPIPWFTTAFVLGLRTNAGGLIGPEGRLELGTRVGLARGFLEIAVHTGIYYSSLEADLLLGTSTIALYQIPLSAEFGYVFDFSARVGMGVSARGGAILVRVNEESTFQPDQQKLLIAPFVEGTLEVTIGVGRGEFLTRIGFGYATAPEGSGLSGNLLGLIVLAGYRLFVV